MHEPGAVADHPGDGGGQHHGHHLCPPLLHPHQRLQLLHRLPRRRGPHGMQASNAWKYEL